MASADRSAVDPVLRLARLLADREQLTPPVPILDLLAKFADVEHDAIPGAVDGLVVERSGTPRPRVVLSTRNRGDNRERFTAAHELGHIVIPWQVGTMFCHPESDFSVDGSEYRALELEANRFAGELLVPAAYLRPSLDTSVDVASRLVQVANECKVSPMVAVFSAVQLLPEWYFFVTRGIETIISASGPVLGSWGRLSWTSDLKKGYESRGGKVSTTSFGPYELHAVRLVVPLSKRPQERATEILDEIIGSISRDPREQRSIRGRVTGVEGSANDRSAAKSPEEFHTLLHSRFLNRPGLVVVTSHRLFSKYLAARAYELADSRGSK